LIQREQDKHHGPAVATLAPAGSKRGLLESVKHNTFDGKGAANCLPFETLGRNRKEAASEKAREIERAPSIGNHSGFQCRGIHSAEPEFCPNTNVSST